MLGNGRPKYLDQDKECVLRAQKGEFDGFRVLYEKYYRDVIQYVSFKVKGLEDAKDITSQVFSRVMDNINQLGPPYHFKNWLYTIVDNQIISYIRKKQSSKIDLQADWESETTDESQKLEQIPDNKSVSRETLAARIIVKRLDAGEQYIFRLRYNDKLNNAEISRLLGKSEPAVRKTVERMKKKFRKLYLQKYKSPVYSGGEKNET